MTTATGTEQLDMVAAIRAKREGKELSDTLIEAIVNGYVAGDIPDYQMSALLMAICFQGFTPAETLALTNAMVESGDTFDPSTALGRRIVDKHSTGGVGDKVSMALAPVVAACGVPLGKMSGRGLGHTGGTLDKLESIPGFSVELSESEFIEQVREVGMAIAGQTGDLVPADRKLYALRDVTGTVESIPLIAASIMSKKLASGAQAIVLDVKVGSGAFMKDLDQARELADAMIEIGRGAGREVKVLLTDMEQPLGNAIGNALEIDEVVEFLKGRGPSDLRELVLESAALLLSLSDLEISEAEGRARAVEAIESGAAYETYQRWIRAQGGDPLAKLEIAPHTLTVEAVQPGIVGTVSAFEIGVAAAHLGAGRQRKEDLVDHGVGIVVHVKVGDQVDSGSALATIYARSEADLESAASVVRENIDVRALAESVSKRSVVLERRG